MFKFGFDEPDGPACAEAAPLSAPKVPLSDDGRGSAGGDAADPARKAWLVDAPPGMLDDSDGLPDAFDALELPGGVHLRKCASAAPPPGLAAASADLVAGAYEGGFKLWEGACDLVAFLHARAAHLLPAAAVLELGAGHALPAVLAAQRGAARVDVADFNEEVLRDVTAVNFRLNCDAPARRRVRLIAGDWDGVPGVVAPHAYDLVLAAEVVYSPDSLHRLARCILRVLKPGGSAYVAGKTYYFGVGGGMRAFEQAIHSCGAEMQRKVATSVVEELRDGKSNVREILRIAIESG